MRTGEGGGLVFCLPGLLLLRLLLGAVTLASASGRDYAFDGFGKIIYRPFAHEADVGVGVGIVNEEEIYFATRQSIAAVHEGKLSPGVQVTDGEITAFHLCHHRGSVLYEVSNEDGLTLFEYSLISRTKAQVSIFHDVSPATSLACVDKFLLRGSKASLLAVNLKDTAEQPTVLRDFLHTGGPAAALEAMTSLTVKFAADLLSKAEVFATVPGNRSVVRLTLASDARGLPRIASQQSVLVGGDGQDGPVASATVLRPSQVLWAADRVVLADGCSLRELRQGRVRTLLGSPGDCAPTASEERLEPVPWASAFGRFAALAGAAEGTSATSVVALTEGPGGKVLLLGGAEGGGSSACAEHSRSEAACASRQGCGWAEGDAAGLRQCLDCIGLQRWADGQACDLERAARHGTRYSLAGCGCSSPSPQPGGDADDDDTIHHKRLWAAMVACTLLGGLACVGFMYRQHRRAARRNEVEFGTYELDTAEFHTFTDDPRCS